MLPPGGESSSEGIYKKYLQGVKIGEKKKKKKFVRGIKRSN